MRSRPRNILTPVREESISSQEPRSGNNTPYHANANDMTQAAEPATATGSSDTYGPSGGRVTTSNATTNPTIYSSAGVGSSGDSGIGLPDTSGSTIMATPTLGDEKAFERMRYQVFGNWGRVAATSGCAVEAYAIFLPVILNIIFSFTQNPIDENNMMQIPLVTTILLKASVFIGMPFGNVLATVLSRKFDEKFVLCGFLGMIFLSSLAMTLTGVGLSIGFFPIIIFWRVLVGFGIGGCRGINALSSARMSNPKWRGSSMIGTNGLYFAIGCGTVCIAVSSALWLWSRDIYQAHHCGATCRLGFDKIWRFVSGVILVNTATALLARIKSNMNAPNPDNTSRVILKFRPKFSTFANEYRKARYIYPLVYTCVLAFFSSIIFYPMLLSLHPIIEQAGFSKPFEEMPDPRQYILRITAGLAIMVFAGITLGYFILVGLLDIWGRRRMLLLSYTLLAPTFTVMAGIWQKMSTEVRMVMVCLSFFLLVTGPIGVGYVYAGEIFPRDYRSWCFMIVDIVGAVGAIAGIVATEYMLDLGRRPEGLDGIRVIWAFYAGCLMPGFLGTFGLVETARKEVGVVEGEVYGDWTLWEDRRSMRPEQGGDGTQDWRGQFKLRLRG
ncbi:hypothetical protein H072_146 [Dactylellina haptotyla CBS 200.50]|uniref:Major facilitator superfamily (MFS) profile domain-containing protein n=1 Tax=Dactylellina haptotyla (strain CBS 200.50) TaxID=1284197 RepID=S8CDK3_DACHA|nr:hypothetical protein H072_146 [Dactylellina haptotyla CBS 200.50]